MSQEKIDTNESVNGSPPEDEKKDSEITSSIEADDESILEEKSIDNEKNKKEDETNDNNVKKTEEESEDVNLEWYEYIIFGLFMALLYVGASSIFDLFKQEKYIEKLVVKNNIIKMINNDADLDSIKHFFNSVNRTTWGFFSHWSKEKFDYYHSNTSLLIVFKDIRNDYFLAENLEENKDCNSKTLQLIHEYEQRNPFDGLEVGQKDYFDNIRMKLSDNYSVVSNDLVKISDELRTKNDLVSKYLADSKTSLYVSIGSIGFALIMACFQIWAFTRRIVNKKD